MLWFRFPLLVTTIRFAYTSSSTRSFLFANALTLYRHHYSFNLRNHHWTVQKLEQRLNYRKINRQHANILTCQMSTSSSKVEISPSNHGTQPLKTFEEARLHPKILEILDKEKWKNPTPIQAHAIPLLQSKLDVMASSPTGSGKSLMFGLPMIQNYLSDESNSSTHAVSTLVISPTRELALQTFGVLQTLSSSSKIKIAMATGGSNLKQQRTHLQSASIVVGTPGRIVQFLNERKLSLRNIKYLVIDEADRLMDMGFELELNRIARALAPATNKQAILCSATFPKSVQRLAADFLSKDYYFVSVGKVGSTQSTIKQEFEFLYNDNDKSKAVTRHVQQFLSKGQNKKKQVIVFSNTKQDVELYGNALKNIRISHRILHGDKLQKDRTKALKDFSSGQAQVLIATDVAARGLDISTIGLVIQADVPKNLDTYTHRVGRTGRAGNTGHAMTLFTNKNVKVASGIVELLQEANQPIPAWLAGMSYLTKAKLLEEEALIAAGSGYDSLEDSTEVVNAEFLGQDFRRHAVEGSYGAEKDTSYRSFDDKAYNLESAAAAASLEEQVVEGEPSFLDEILPHEETDIETIAQEEDACNNNPLLKESINNNIITLVSSKPSKALSDILIDITGKRSVVSTPNPKVLSFLSTKKRNSLPQFEYLGLFSFEQILPLLQDNKSGQSKHNNQDLPRVLMVAEKPSIALAIAEALSGPRGPRKRRGISPALPVYEFTTTSFEPSQDSSSEKNNKSNQERYLVTVTSVVGHIFSLGFDTPQGKKNDPSTFFHLPIVKQQESTTMKLRVIDHLQALAAQSSHLVLWLDCDAEGENIAHEVIAITRNAFVDSSSNIIQRAQFSAITPQALRDAFRSLKQPNANLSKSVDARQELDLRIGVALTRLLTWKCVGLARSKFDPSTRLVSYGPCQTPALSFCVDRAREIQQFQPTTYYKVCIEARASNGIKTPLMWKNGSYQGERNATPNKALAEQLVEQVKKDATVVVVNVQENSDKILPPLGLNTVALLEAGSKAMGMSPKQVMNVAEKLYSQGLISYPRTETTRYDPNGFDVRSALKEHAKHDNWGRTASYLLRTKYSKTGKPPLRGKDVGDHPPITPLKAATRNEVGSGSAWRVYEFVCRTFLGSLHNQLSFTRRVATLQIENDSPELELELVTVDSLGFSDCCPWVLRDIGADKSLRELLLEQGTRFKISEATLQKANTKPPRFLQEHELIRLMDENRIGTDASMAVHVENIVNRGYVILCDETGLPLRQWRPPRPGQKPLPRQVGRYMIPTSLGMGLVDLFDTSETTSLLAQPAIRGTMEQEVKQIASGMVDKDSILDKNLHWFEARYQELASIVSDNSRIKDFGRSLSPTRTSLKQWRNYGVFEELVKAPSINSSNKRRAFKKKKPQQFNKRKPKTYRGKAKGTIKS